MADVYGGLSIIANNVKKNDHNDTVSIKSNKSLKSNKSTKSKLSKSSDVSKQSQSYSDKSTELSNKDKPQEIKLTSEQIKIREKSMLFTQLKTLKKHGVHLTKDYTYNDNVEEMKQEIQIQRQMMGHEDNVELFFNVVQVSSSSVEYISKQFSVDMDGFSTQVNISKSKYIVIIDEILEKYNVQNNMSPEMKLIMLFGSSAIKYGLVKAMTNKATSMLGEELGEKLGNNLMKIVNDNPTLLKDAINGILPKNDKLDNETSKELKQLNENLQYEKINNNVKLPNPDNLDDINLSENKLPTDKSVKKIPKKRGRKPKKKKEN